MTSEWPFGNIKENLKYTEYNTRGEQDTDRKQSHRHTHIKRIYKLKINKFNSNEQQNT